MNTATLTLAALLLATPAFARPEPAPPRPANLVATAGSTGRVLVKWDDDGLASEYRIQRQPSFRQGVISIPSDYTAFVDEPGRGNYTYYVWAVNSSGASESVASSRIRILNGRVGPYGAANPDGSLVDLSGSSLSGSTLPRGPRFIKAVGGTGVVALTWQDRANNETRFELQRERREGTSDWTMTQTFMLPGNTEMLEQSLDAGVYRFRVRAANNYGGSDFTAWAIANVTSGQPTPSSVPPAFPTGLSVSDIGGGRAMVSWADHATNEQGFRIERNPASASGTVTVGANTTTLVDQCNNGTFSYRVQAFNAAGASVFTPWVSVSVSSASTSGGTGGGGSIEPPAGSGSTNTGGGSTGGGGTSGGGGGSTGGGGGSTGGGGGTTGGGSNTSSFASLQGTPAYPGPSVDAAGWSELTPSPESRIVYVSYSSGSDSNNGLSQSSPVKTLSAGYAQMRDGYPDWMVLKCGDTWPNANIHWDKNGLSATKPMVIGSYGSGNRPLLLSGAGSAFTSAYANLAITGLHMRPGSGITVTDTVTPYGIVMITGFRPMGNILIEDCVVEGYFKGIVVDFFNGDKPFNYKLRRNVIVDCYNTGGAHTAGAYFGGVNGLLIEECVFDHNGWRTDIPGASPNIFRRNLYVQHNSTNVSIRGNIFARSAAEGFQQRAGGLCEENLVLKNGVSGIFIANTGIVRNNVVLDSRDLDPGNPRGCGIDAADLVAGEVSGNICAYRTTPGTYGIWGISLPHLPPTGAFSAHDNLVYDWQWNGVGAAYAMGCPIDFKRNVAIQPTNGCTILYKLNNPWPGALASGNRYRAANQTPIWMEGQGRAATWSEWQALATESGSSMNSMTPPPAPPTIGSYAASVGLSPTLESFLAHARNQSKANWRSDLSAPQVNAAIRAGFGVATQSGE